MRPSRRRCTAIARLEVIWTVTPALMLALVFVLMVRRCAPSKPRRRRAAAAGDRPPVVVGVPVPGPGRWSPPTSCTCRSARRCRSIWSRVDVIHSFHVPQFGWMRDTVPGQDQPDVGHGRSRRHVRRRRATSTAACSTPGCACGSWPSRADQFDAWVAAAARSRSLPSGARGEQVFLQNTCVNCHAIRGLPAPAAPLAPT